MTVDFSLILVVATAVTGAIWGIDALLFKPRRVAAAGGMTPVREPTLVEYARSFFPVILIVLLVRSFLFEPFRIPSDSMMPTLLDGDFIFVNKYAYGLRVPVLNEKIIETGEPKRGDVIVFRLPSDPSTNYIKRLVGLPGDHIAVFQDKLVVNGQLVPVKPAGIYKGLRHDGARIGEENLFGVRHRVLFMPERWPYFYGDGQPFEVVVPEGRYFFMGDNRDNSRDSRYPEVGLVPERNLVGKAVRIWLNWRLPEAAPIWSRIGDRIQ
ncbi:MAG TPA: signal peptidase I [Steroidobacteraceae bacterium]|nr:signal peptidase I [Steroidobacteraceae bacterium]